MSDELQDSFETFLPLTYYELSIKSLQLYSFEGSITLIWSDGDAVEQIEMESMAKAICVRSLHENQPEYVRSLQSSILKYSKTSPEDIRIYSYIVSVLLIKRGIFSGVLPRLEYIHSEDTHFTIYYKLNLNLNTTLIVAQSSLINLRIIYENALYLLSDLLSIGIYVKKFDAAEDLLIGESSFQFISIGKFRPAELNLNYQNYMAECVESLDRWASLIPNSIDLALSLFQEKVRLNPMKFYSDSIKRVESLFYLRPHKQFSKIISNRGLPAAISLADTSPRNTPGESDCLTVRDHHAQFINHSLLNATTGGGSKIYKETIGFSKSNVNPEVEAIFDEELSSAKNLVKATLRESSDEDILQRKTVTPLYRSGVQVSGPLSEELGSKNRNSMANFCSAATTNYCIGFGSTPFKEGSGKFKWVPGNKLESSDDGAKKAGSNIQTADKFQECCPSVDRHLLEEIEPTDLQSKISSINMNSPPCKSFPVTFQSKTKN